MSTAPLAPLPGTAGCQTAPSGALLRLPISLLGKTSPPPRGRATSRLTRGLPAWLPADGGEACAGVERGSSKTGGATKPVWKVLLVNCVSTGSAMRAAHPVPGTRWVRRCGSCAKDALEMPAATQHWQLPVTRDLVPLASSLPLSGCRAPVGQWKIQL